MRETRAAQAVRIERSAGCLDSRPLPSLGPLESAGRARGPEHERVGVHVPVALNHEGLIGTPRTGIGHIPCIDPTQPGVESSGVVASGPGLAAWPVHGPGSSRRAYRGRGVWDPAVVPDRFVSASRADCASIRSGIRRGRGSCGPASTSSSHHGSARSFARAYPVVTPPRVEW